MITRSSHYIVEQSDRLLLFLFATTGVITVACVTGLPSATCYALADTYTIALLTLGVLFIVELLLGVFMAILKGITNVQSKSRTQPTSGEIGVSVIVIVLLTISLWLSVVLANSGYGNIRLAINYCFLEKSQTKDNLHDRIPLYRDPLSHPFTKLGYEPTGGRHLVRLRMTSWRSSCTIDADRAAEEGNSSGVAHR